MSFETENTIDNLNIASSALPAGASTSAKQDELLTKLDSIGIQTPWSVNGDSVYAQDIWVEESDMGDFSGDITDLFDNLHSVISNTTSDNPKTLFIHFNRTIVSNAIGLGAYTGNFSNVKIEIVNTGGVYTTVIDESGSSTDYTSRTFQLPVTAGFNAIRITFHTADQVSLSNCVILKSRSSVVRLQAVKPDNTVIDINATTGGNLKTSLEEFDSGVSVNSNSQLRVTPFFADGVEYRNVNDKLLVSSKPYLYDISKGNIAGKSSFTKYGRVGGVNNTLVDVWYGEGGTASQYVFPATAQQMDVLSSSVNDDDGGTGVNSLYIVGLDSNYEEISETITLDGTTAVTTVNSYLRINGCRAVSVGSGGVAAGDIIIQNLANTTTYACMPAGLTVCRDLVYTVPAGYTLYLTSMTTASGKGGNTTNLNAVIFTPKVKLFGSDIWVPQGELLTINSDVIRGLELPARIPEKSDVKMSVIGDYASGSATCIGAVRGWIEENE